MGIVLQRIECKPYTRTFATTVCTAAGKFIQRQGLHVLVTSHDGMIGYGDMAAWPGFCDMGDVQVLQQLVGYCISSMGDIAQMLQTYLLSPPACYAIELACLDLLAQTQHCSMATLLGCPANRCVPVHAQVSNTNEARCAVQKGYRTLKIKIGSQALEDDIARVSHIRDAVGPSIALRLDANGAWDFATAQHALRAFAKISPEFLEEPLARSAGYESLQMLEALHNMHLLPIAADEHLVDATASKMIIETCAVDVVILKPMFLGGIVATLVLAQQALQRGMAAVITHAFDSAIGRAGAFYAAACLCTSQNDIAHGLADPFIDDMLHDIKHIPHIQHGYAYLETA